jgi:acetyltransferase-like isoleucine patch superfamily enzyme
MLKKLWWYWTTNRLGPDVPLTHLLLFSRRLGRWVCRKKFKEFGEGSEVRPYTYVVSTQNVSFGNNVVLRPGSMIFADDETTGTVTIEDDVLMGAGVHFYVNNHKYDRTDITILEQGYYPSAGVRVCRGAWIGANAIILPGVTIGQNAVVGAGSIVTKSVDDFTVVAGSPAKAIKKIGDDDN